MKEIINTNKAPAAIGPYSQATKAGGFLFLSGQMPLDPETMSIVPGCVACQVEQVMKNTKNILDSQELNFTDVVKTTVFIKNMDDFGKVNEVYAKYFNENPPARSCVEVARLPKDVLIEMECIVALR